MEYKVASFYQFITLADPAALRAPLLDFCKQLDLRGTVLLAPEGINATLAGQPAAVDALITALQSGSIIRPAFAALELKFSNAEDAHFDRLKIKIKREIITFGHAQADPSQTGIYVAPADWNALLEDPDTLLLDTRNDFEVAMGSFAGAVDPALTSFSGFADFVKTLGGARTRKIAMYCTGGIRCEKASAYMRGQGFDQVYQLQGGILKYLETIPKSASKFHGECFVFDRRNALGHGLVLQGTRNGHAISLDSARQNIAQ